MDKVLIQCSNNIYKYLSFLDIENLSYVNKTFKKVVEFTCQVKFKSYPEETQLQYNLADSSYQTVK